ncbi:tetratricopeptide repeat protein [Paramicrobacterium agarici]|uniref:Tetratricopeptide repeat protein n=1 Tax=Paramicrobacterium agarici TaxID=630514 RepID=A0A2A9DXK8_9MICO|nr:tetratricopeptide repeat protein [Microbacterium agarici]PFG31418.1 tetratricopeptide repeat protein [Microbacterium agarici]
MDTDPALRAELDAIFEARDRSHMAPTIAAVVELLSQHPDDPAVLYEVGGAYDTDGQEEVAAEFYRRAMNAGLDGRWLRQCYLQYGSTLRNLGRVDESIAIFDEALRAFPESESLAIFRALSVHAAGKPSAALGAVLELIADRYRTDEVLRYEEALRGNAAHLQSVDER